MCLSSALLGCRQVARVPRIGPGTDASPRQSRSRAVPARPTVCRHRSLAAEPPQTAFSPPRLVGCRGSARSLLGRLVPTHGDGGSGDPATGPVEPPRAGSPVAIRARVMAATPLRHRCRGFGEVRPRPPSRGLSHVFSRRKLERRSVSDRTCAGPAAGSTPRSWRRRPFGGTAHGGRRGRSLHFGRCASWSTMAGVSRMPCAWPPPRRSSKCGTTTSSTCSTSIRPRRCGRRSRQPFGPARRSP
jgi:hypothetical protein